MEGLLFVVLIIGILVLLLAQRRAGAKSVTLSLPSFVNLAIAQSSQPHHTTNFAFNATKQSTQFIAADEIRQPTLSSIRIAPGPNAIISIGPHSPVMVEPTQTLRIAPITVVEPELPIRIEPRESTLIQPTRVMQVTVRPASSARVEPPQRGAWDERGWRRQIIGRQEVYDGTFQAVDRRRGVQLSYPGRVMNHRGQITAYISSPPPEIKRHQHGACFQLTRDGWFQLHWSRPAQNPDDAILYMERVLDESINR
jgi:hypothetical protein